MKVAALATSFVIGLVTGLSIVSTPDSRDPVPRDDLIRRSMIKPT